MNEMETSQEDRTWAMIAHLSGLAAAVASAGLLIFVGPLIVWLVKKNESSYVDDQGKEALNFQLTVFLLYIPAVAFTAFTCGMGFPVLFVPFILQIIFGIVAALKVNSGVWYRYPINIRFIK